MMRVYVDDSGKPDSSPSLVLAGFSASEADWGRFTDQWQEMLGRHGVTTFHMTDLWSMQPKSGVRSKVTQSSIMVNAVETVKRHLSHAFAVSVPFDAHHHWFATKEFPKDKPLRTYPFAFNSLLALVCKHMWLRHCDQPLQVLFEEQGDESHKLILGGMQEFRRLNAIHFPGLEMLEPEFIPGEDCAPLQAADLLAWLVRKDASNAFNRVDRRWAAEAVMLGEVLSIGNTVKVWTEAELEAAATAVAQSITATNAAGREPGVAETEKGGPDARLPS